MEGKSEVEKQEEMLFKAVLGEMIDTKYTLLSATHVLKIVVAVTMVFSRRYNVK